MHHVEAVSSQSLLHSEPPQFTASAFFPQGMKDTYSTYMDSIQEALGQRPDPDRHITPDGRIRNGAVANSAASPAATAGGKQPLALGSPLARQLWERWFRDVLTGALLLATLWLMRRAVADAAACAETAAAAGDGALRGFWQGRRVVFTAGSAWPQLQAVPGAL